MNLFSMFLGSLTNAVEAAVTKGITNAVAKVFSDVQEVSDESEAVRLLLPYQPEQTAATVSETRQQRKARAS